MKRGYSVWTRITGIHKRILGVSVMFILCIVVNYYIEPKYIAYINNLQVNSRKIYLLISFFMLTGLFMLIKKVFEDAIVSDFQFQYWLDLSTKEFYVYLIMVNINYYYFFMLMILITSKRIIENIIFFVMFFSSVYIAMTYYIYLRKCKIMYIKNKRQIFINQNKKDMFNFNNNILELIYFGWRYRYASAEGIICKIIVIFLGIYFRRYNLSNKWELVLYLILVIILTFTDDNFWKCEIVNAFFIRQNGISLKKYYVINLISAILFHESEIVFIYVLGIKKITSFVLFLILATFFVCYWTTVYLYLYLIKLNKSELLKQVFLFAMLILEFIPVINFVVGLYLLKKTKYNWRQIQC